MRLKRDDGVVIYLNGREVYRDLMPTGVITAETLSTTWAPDDGQTWQSASLPTSELVNGRNVIAVEIHQNARGSLDISFDMELQAQREAVDFGTPAAPNGLRGSALSQTAVALEWNEVPGATEYRVFRDGTLVGSPSGASFEDVGLSSDTEYSYAVRARSAAGTSGSSAELVLRTEVSGAGGAGEFVGEWVCVAVRDVGGGSAGLAVEWV